MTTLPLGMIIEGMVAVLLLITIGYCWMLNRRLQRLRADEQVLRATISELMTATEIAERAILGLKTTAAEADKTLGTRLKQAETMSHSLADQLGEGEKVFTRITQIAEAARSAMPARESAPHNEVYAAPPQTSAAAYAPQKPSYAPASHYGGPAAPEPEPERKRSRTSDIRSAAAEATARLEEFRRRKGAAA